MLGGRVNDFIGNFCEGLAGFKSFLGTGGVCFWLGMIWGFCWFGVFAFFLGGGLGRVGG